MYLKKGFLDICSLNIVSFMQQRVDGIKKKPKRSNTGHQTVDRKSNPSGIIDTKSLKLQYFSIIIVNLRLLKDIEILNLLFSFSSSLKCNFIGMVPIFVPEQYKNFDFGTSF